MIRRIVCALSTGLAGLMLIGCASTPSPRYIGTNYYMVGDNRCAQYRPGYYGGSILCYTSKNEFTESRFPMSQSDMQMHQMMSAREAVSNAALMSQAEAMSRQMNQQSQQLLQQSQGYQAPAVNSYQQPNNTVHCITAGIYTNCRY